ncbi:MAG: magnesium chelatase, partial [Armatimonadetes bacterium CG_4_10_14_0_8_um_filter_66_14]
VLPDDVKGMAVAVLAHRLILEPEARLEGLSSEEVVQEILGVTPVAA